MNKQRPVPTHHPIRRRAAIAGVVVAMFAVAAPVAGAAVPAPAPAHSGVAIGPTFVDTVFNGATSFVVSA